MSEGKADGTEADGRQQTASEPEPEPEANGRQQTASGGEQTADSRQLGGKADGRQQTASEPGPRFAPELKLRVLDWVLEEQLSGRSPTSEDVARHFGLTDDRAEALREEFERMGELVNGGRDRRVRWT